MDPRSDPPDPEDEPGASPSDFGRALDDFEGALPASGPSHTNTAQTPGAKVRGKVVAIAPDHALIDIGARSEALVDLVHFRNEDGTARIAVGDDLDLFVLETGDQIMLAPSLRADPHAGLERMREAKAAGIPVSGRVTALNGGGLQVDIGGIRGFCPMSQIESGYCAEPSSYLGRTLEFLITAIEEPRSSVVLSRRLILRGQEEAEAQRRLATLKPGDELQGTVRRLEPFGAFVDLGGIDGMVHVSEIQHGNVAHPRDVLREGEKVRVRVLRLDRGKDGKPRVALSIKASAPDPWTGIPSRVAPGNRVRGVVARLADFGAFVTLEPGVDGLVHVSEIAPHHVNRVKDELTVGQEVEAMVLAVDPAKKRISLSIRAAIAAGAPEPRQAQAGHTPEGAANRVTPGGAVEEPPLTTMAIALRAAAERARRKQGGR
jgi:small subunit ribosomal protein S1